MKHHVFYLTLLLLLCSISASAQLRVTGKVSSADDGKPISFATVSVKGQTVVATTTEDGSYAINVPKGATTLVFSFFGMKSKEVEIGGQSVIDVPLENEAQTLDETIVVAYGTSKKGTYTGAASVLKGDRLKDQPVTSFQNALDGQIPGLQFSQTSGQAGSVSSIRIRGTGSISAGSEPLYVVDGVPVVSGDASQLSYVSSNVMSTINPADIESITVLKDAAASALYGSRAANGVIIVTTKKGKKGKARVDFKMNIGITPEFAYNNFETASPEEMRALVYENRYNGYIASGKYTPAQADVAAKDQVTSSLPVDPRGYYDWEDALFRTGVFQSYEASVSGANDMTSYYTSASYTNDQGRSYTNSMERLSARLNVTQKVGTFVELGSNINIAQVNKTGFNDTRNSGSNYFYAVRNLLFQDWWPTDVNGLPVTSRFPSYAYNYLYYDDLKDQTSDMFKLSAVESLTAKILPELTAKTVFSYDQTRTDDHSYYAPEHYNASGTKGKVDEYSTKIAKLVSSTTLVYDKRFAEKHNLNALIGFEAEENQTNFLRSTATQLPGLATVVAVGGVKDANGYYYGNTMLSVLSRLEYNYDDRYYLSGSYRRDGSSRFAADTRWGDFWSVAASWRMKNESFLKNVGWLSGLRVRASYGVNGTMPLENYASLSLYSYYTSTSGSFSYSGNPGGTITTMGNPLLTWESNYTGNLAVESSFFDSRLNFNIEYYNRKSTNLLQPVQLSRVTGISEMLMNVGEMNNQGFEIELSGDVIRTKDWTWNLGINAATLRSRVVKLYGGSDIVWADPTGGDGNAYFVYREGFSPKSFYGYEYAGVDPDNGKPMWYLNNSTTPDKTINGRPATYNKAWANDVIIGCADPDVYGGINSSLKWKGLSFLVSCAYSLGGDSYNATAKDNQDDGFYSIRVMSKAALDRWQQPGDVTKTPQRVYDRNSAQSTQSRWLDKNNYLRVKNVTLSYNLPESLMKKLPISNIRVYTTASNLLTWARIKEYDPEVNIYGTRAWEMPQGKTYTFGLELGF